MKLVKATIFLTVALTSHFVSAGNVRNDVPSCTTDVPSEYYQLSNERELFVLVDKTMAHYLADDIKSNLFNDINRFIKPGDSVQVVEFSSFARDSYTKVTFKGQLDKQLDDKNRSYVKKSVLKSLDQCLVKQRKFMTGKLGQSLQAAFEPQDKPTNTELIGTLKDIGNQVLSHSVAKRKVVLLVSDMLENSDITSFYGNNRVRTIEPKTEINRVSSADMFANFNNSDFYVVGTGVLPGANNYLSAQKMNKLDAFWADYFSSSQARLLGFGKPMLLSEIR